MSFISLLACFWVEAMASEASEAYSDPLHPQESTEASPHSEVSMFQIGERLSQIEELIKQEKQALQSLAPLQPAKQFDTFGYHSDYLPVVSEAPDEPRWSITFKEGKNPTQALVLVPALDQRSSKIRGYAFPKRFRISSVTKKGEILKVLVDWKSQDFPNPGMRPVYFAFPDNLKTKGQLRIDIYAGHVENRLEFFALGRVHPIRQGEQQFTSILGTSSSFESTPYWSNKYLASQRQILGMPLSASTEGGDNLIMKLPASRLKKPVIIRIELDKEEALGWINLFPGQSPDGIDVPGYGFPNDVKFYSVMSGSAKLAPQRVNLNRISKIGNLGNSMYKFAGNDRKLEALEIECNGFPKHQGQAVFSLGEIEIIKGKRILSQGRKVTIRGLELDENVNLKALVDGKVSGRDILPLPEWYQQLAKGKTHESSLIILEAEHKQLSERWKHIRQQTIIWISILVSAAILTFFWLMIRNKHLAEKRLRQQIYSDLHDEVGSNLGSISLMAGQLEGIAKSDRMKAGMFDLALMTREACASIREVVWLVDQKTIRLPDLVRKLGERTERILNASKVTVEIQDDLPDTIVSMPIKRHMIMFFKELLHNCARHAHATHVRMAITVEQGHLLISVTDNGNGFNKTKKSDGWGLNSMKQRAQEIGGEMKLISIPGEGTTITLTVPISKLSKQPNKTYQTSN